jgi:hypothetical protein
MVLFTQAISAAIANEDEGNHARRDEYAKLLKSVASARYDARFVPGSPAPASYCPAASTLLTQ